MIKVESKGNSTKIEVTGDRATILAELAYAANRIHEAIEKTRGKEVADKEIKRVFKMALMSEEEIDKEYEAKKALLQENILEFVNGLIAGGNK